MNEYLSRAKKFFDENHLRIDKTFELEAEEFKRYINIIREINAKERNNLIELAEGYVDRMRNQSFPDSVKPMVKMNIKLDLYTEGIDDGISKTTFLRKYIFKETFKDTHKIIDANLYQEWLNLQLIKHEVAFKLANKKVLPSEKKDWLREQYIKNQDKYMSDKEWAEMTAEKFEKEFDSPTSPGSMLRYGKYDGQY